MSLVKRLARKKQIASLFKTGGTLSIEEATKEAQTEINTKIIKTIQAITGHHIAAVHGEANNYTFKIQRGWETLSYEFVNNLAGYHPETGCLID